MKLDPGTLDEPLVFYAAADGRDYALSRLEIAVKDLRGQVVRLLEIADPEAYLESKYEDGDNPCLDARRDAYAFAFECLLLRGYSIPGF